MKIDRRELIKELATFARDGSGVVIGAPGVGKSYALAELRDNLKLNKVLHLILPVERLGAATDAELKVVLKRDGNFIELLRTAASNSKTPAILIFDGFDAARGESERAGVLSLIFRAVNELRGQWNTIVSVRTFDAMKSRRLLELFPSDRENAGFGKGPCRQFLIPPLRPEEVIQALEQVPGLRELHSGGSQDFRNLLTIPFNLWLIERIIRAGARVGEFSKITSEVQLLEMYWNYRVRKAFAPQDREFILAKITRAMVESHTLTVRREGVYHPKTQTAWEGLLSDEILIEHTERNAYVSFTHNILFDFAVSAHLLESDPVKLAKFVAEEPARPLFLRPSLLYHFTRLWHFEREIFWRIFWGVVHQQEIHLRQIIRLVLPAVLVNEAQTIEDLTPLLERLNKREPLSLEAVAFLLQALRILQSPKKTLWAEFIQVIGHNLDQRFAWDAGMIATAIIDTKETQAGKSTVACGEFGRHLLRWAWNSRDNNEQQPWFERLAGLIAIPLVAKTYATNPQESRKLIEKVVQVVGMPGFPIDCIYRLTINVELIIPHDPELVGLLYERLFGYEEKSQAKTNMGSPVMGMISTRSQDYSMCRYSLIKAFPYFLAQNPFQAVRSGIRSVQAFAALDHAIHYLNENGFSEPEFKFQFRGSMANYVEDRSAIWDFTPYPDKELGIADNFFGWFSSSAKDARIQDVEMFLDIFCAEASLGFLWSRLLAVGTEHPALLGPILWELLKSKPLLLENDALFAIGSFLEQTAKFFTKEQRQEIESAILEIPRSTSDVKLEYLERRRNRLIARIPRELLVTAEAIVLRDKLAVESNLPPNQPLFQVTTGFSKFSEEDSFRGHGAKPEKPQNHEIIELYKPLIEWSSKNKDASVVDSLLPSAHTLRDRLLDECHADVQIIRTAWTHLSSFASDAILQTKSSDSDKFRLLRQIILESSVRPDPQPDPHYDLSWDHASWSPAPRNEAAQALPWLTHFGEDHDVITAIQNVAKDPVPSVRFLLACELWRLAEHVPDLMWAIFNDMAQHETNVVVLQGITVSLWQLIHRANKNSCLLLIGKLLARLDEQSDEDETKARGSLVCMVVDFAVCEDNQWARETLNHWRNKPIEFAASIATTGRRLVDYIEPRHVGVRLEQARSLLLTHLDVVANALGDLHKKDSGVPDDEMQRKWRLLYGVVDQTVLHIYFATDIDPNLRQRKDSPLDDSSRKMFFFDALPVLEKIIDFGKRPETGMLLAPTAHHFMQLLNGVLPYDPPLVLRMAADVVRCSKRFNYNLDSMAMGEVVKLVECILADYRDKIQDELSIINLLELLDAFVEVGWPEALNLVWRLDEIYR